MPKHNKCMYEIYDINKYKYRYCKNNRFFFNFCRCHYEYIYLEHIVKIQSVYKGFYIRKKLKIYYNLPREIQRKIIWHMNEDIYLRHFNSSIFKLIKNRYKNFYNKTIYNKILTSDNIDNDLFFGTYLVDNTENFTQFMTELFSLLRLSIKYYHIINVKKLNKTHMNNIINFTNKLSFYIPFFERNNLLVNRFNRLFPRYIFN